MYLTTHVFSLRTERRSPKRHSKTMPLPSPAKEQEEQSEEVEAVTGGVTPHEVDNRKPPKLWLAVVMLLAATISIAWNSELLVGALKPVTEQLCWLPGFIGLVI